MKHTLQHTWSESFRGVGVYNRDLVATVFRGSPLMKSRYDMRRPRFFLLDCALDILNNYFILCAANKNEGLLFHDMSNIMLTPIEERRSLVWHISQNNDTSLFFYLDISRETDIKNFWIY